ncbi:MAG TPA: selenocysteine-specific translation elongation factor [Pyrinomonadaceae bacterium]|nr:selenocysteine-specific translation elongation factor [Pyrinomonadaceae bacterium]
MRSIIIGTAGHIDHGKSSLVHTLTGKDPDRLPEEKRRGITIDLGFADLDLGDVRVGFVDVPGHERFVKNMLAGVHGIDAVALVIAADEGVMPQTREHFDICRLLGVQKGLIAITKTDLVEDELLSLVLAEAEELVTGSFLEGATTVAVSAKTRAGLDELREALRKIADDIPPRSSDYTTRLPIDRAFSMKGFGAVVTGTLVSGEIAEADELELLPPGRRVRARGVQVHGAAVNRAESGQRTAVNLAGVDVSDIQRGMVLAQPGRLIPTQIIDTQIAMLPSAPRPIRTRSRLRVHLGSAEVLARVRVLNNRGDIPPGETGFAQLRLEAPVVAVHEDRFIIRSYSPAETIAGGLVLDPLAAKHRGRELARTHQRLQVLMDSDRPARFAEFVNASGDSGLRLSNIAARTGWKDCVLSQVAASAVKDGTVVESEGVFVAKEIFERLSRTTVDAVKAHHHREPLSRGLARETLRDRLFAHASPELFRTVISRLEEHGLLATDKDIVRSKEHTLELSPADAQLRDRMLAILEKAGLAAPSLEQLLESSGVAASQRAHGRKILQLLLDNGTAVRVQNEMFFHAEALKQLTELLRQYGNEHEPDRLIDVAAFKDLAGVSRKYAIPLLEYFDLARVTRRAGDRRTIL